MTSHWKNLKVSNKIGIGIGSVVLILCIVSILSILDVSDIVRNASEVINGNKLDALLAQKEVDHLNWAHQVNALLTDDRITELNVEFNDQQCAFGKWLYGEERKWAEALVPELAPLLKAIEKPHKQLHESAKAIKDHFRQTDSALPALLLEKEIGHLKWVANIRGSLLNHTPITVETDHTRCSFGTWINSHQAGKTLAAGNEAFKKTWEDLLIHHEKLHESAQDVKDALANSHNAALNIFKSKTIPELAATSSSFGTLKEITNNQLSGMHTAFKIYTESTMPTLQEIQALLEKIRETAHENILTDRQMLAIAGQTRRHMVISSVLAVSIGILLTWLIARSISRPIIKGADFAKIIASGDLTRKLDVSQDDEIGVLSNALNDMSVNLRKMFHDIVTGVQTLSSSSTELSSVSEQMASHSDQTSEKANSVSAAAEEMSANMNNIASTMEQTTSNIQMIVSSSEEMTTTLNEIAASLAKGRETTRQGVNTARDVSSKVDQLGAAANDINVVTETISKISEQTNLLALNATIEAARAGEAGKGFAVVAGEIKDLAQQTAEATQKITQKINDVQSNTGESVAAIQSILGIINDIDSIVTGVASSMEEQSVTTQEISSNVSQASCGLGDVNKNVTQASMVSEEVSKNISEVSQATNEINAGSDHVKKSAAELSKLSEDLNEMVKQFIL